MPINGVAVSSVAIGSLLIWSGVKGWNLTATAGQIITGKAPSGTVVNSLTVPQANVSNSSGGAITVTANALANQALTYVGHAYSYGGAPGKNGQNPWDCSSFMNWLISVIGHGAIPGYGAGQYDGTVHGPPTGSWLVWPGMSHVPLSQVQAGDIIVWANHMGMAIDSSHLVSALNSQLGTLVTTFAGTGNGTPLVVGRLK